MPLSGLKFFKSKEAQEHESYVPKDEDIIMINDWIGKGRRKREKEKKREKKRQERHWKYLNNKRKNQGKLTIIVDYISYIQFLTVPEIDDCTRSILLPSSERIGLLIMGTRRWVIKHCK